MKLFPIPEPKLGVDRSTQVIRWLGRNSLRFMHSAGEQQPPAGEIANWLTDIVRGKTLYPTMDEYKAMVKIENQIMAAARWAVQNYDAEHPTYVRARNGGLKGGKAVRKSALELRERIRALSDLSPTEVARELGISRRHVYNVRAEIKAETSVDDWDLEPITPEVDDWDLEPVSENVEDDHLDEAPEPPTYEDTRAQLIADRDAEIERKAAERTDDILLDLGTPAEAPAGTPAEDVWADVIFLDDYRKPEPVEEPQDDIVEVFTHTLSWGLV